MDFLFLFASKLCLILCVAHSNWLHNLHPLLPLIKQLYQYYFLTSRQIMYASRYGTDFAALPPQTHEYYQTRWMSTKFTYNHNTYEECLWFRFLHPVLSLSPSVSSTSSCCSFRSDVSNFKCCLYHRIHWLNYNFEEYIIRWNISKVCSLTQWHLFRISSVCLVQERSRPCPICVRVVQNIFWREKVSLVGCCKQWAHFEHQKKNSMRWKEEKLYCGWYKGEVRALNRIIGVCSL